ncbi:carbon starvation protein A [Campylobacter pinnipediorum subsp. caledonicus]|uniref:Carbon starvation protein A n=1 Tax=Campylobacter pinnipediorum subsp. caledonicus TaxID=1874362 RepID=A0A1S6U5W5_9BACT|nr:carbon starvation protein A [Campylobacter pinnipediorum]AQW85541.1 carbon starvation protein A [Campylobacter pinnipediorum subsp. caledonicus]AQW87082.1 carbon starvation protein A [Campylobacter pinnipediorum subsp. caledonicus]OPA71823.1 carbon starvation protein CstA [Campylobacter pinnipediorum subsp. caledonicus]
MNAVWLMLVGFAVFSFGWFVYSRLYASKVLELDDNFTTPAHEYRDNVDFVPANKFVLWGHHFTAVAGAAPIVGPAIAVQWGWLPAFLWVIIGTVAFAGIHDMSALWASVKNEGKSIGTICTRFVGSKVGQLFMIVIFLVLLMVNGAFGVIIAKESVEHTSTIIPAWGAVAIALIMGQAIYKFKMKLVPVTIVAVIALYALVPLGVAVPLSLPDSMFGLNQNAQWVVLLYIYAGIASILPVWALLQPRDYVNGIQLFVGLILLYTSIIIVHPTVAAPTFIPAITDNPGGWHVVVPVLFITVACGAISGFHGIVSSGTTSKQVDKMKDVRFVGYLGAMGEGSLSLATIIACVAGLSLINADLNLDTWADLYKGGTASFVAGGGAIIYEGLGIPQEASATLLSLMVILFAATTMDAGIRLQRYIIQEWGDIYNIGFLRGKGIATIVAVITSFTISMNGVSDGKVAIWPLFGATNQLLASLTLLVVAVILLKSKKFSGSLIALIPMSFILVMSFWGAIIKLGDYYNDQNYLLTTLNAIVIVVTLLVVLSALKVISKILADKKAAA